MTPIYDFTWKGRSAFRDFGIAVLSLGSSVIAERRDDPHVVAGRSGLVHDQDGAVEEIDRKLTLYLPYEQNANTAALADIRAWLKGYGVLTLSTIEDRTMMAWITDMIAFDPVVEGFSDLKGDVIFRCDPYLYHAGVEPLAIPEAGFIVNPGTADARPVITVDATGDVDLTIGTETLLLSDLDGPVIINSVAEEAYALDGSGGLVNMNARMTGDFPRLAPGSVAVGWALGEGAVMNGVTMIPNWRDEN